MGCLALNASFEPLTIIPARRAIRLVLDQKAEILEVDKARAFRSPRTQLPFPTVIRLVRFVHVPRRFRRQVTNTFPVCQRRVHMPVLWPSPWGAQGPAVPHARPYPPPVPGRGQFLAESRFVVFTV